MGKGKGRYIVTKYEIYTKKLIEKICMSKTEVPGFVIGLSGTDSILAFDMLYTSLQEHCLPMKPLVGIHFANARRKKPTWFEEHIIPWMKAHYPGSDIRVVGLYENTEVERWASIQRVSKAETLWTVASVNATEDRLGKYTILAKSASIWPISKFWKSEILFICKHYINIPDIAIEMSQIPDCLCGRDELAAQNIHLIDDILRHRIIPSQHDSETLDKVMAWVYDTKQEFDFKTRTPYQL